MLLNILGDGISRKHNPTINADYFWRLGIIRDFHFVTYLYNIYLCL